MTSSVVAVRTADTGTFTRDRVERIIGLTLALSCLVFGVQAFLAALGSTETGGWHLPLTIGLFSLLALVVVTGLLGRGERWAAAAFAIAFPLVLIVWPFISTGGDARVNEQPWIWYLVNIATIAAAFAFPLRWAIGWTAVMPVLYVGARLIQVRGDADFWLVNIADASFALIFGFILLVLAWMFRTVGDGVDEARHIALTSYEAASATQAREQERIEMAALMHDSVLSALIAAARATTPRERELSVAMSQDALTGLANAESDIVAGSIAPVPARQISDDLNQTLTAFGLDVQVERPAEVLIPGRVARAITLAATQAIANAVQHAGARGLVVLVIASPDRCETIVRDRGPGMDVRAIPDDRLGLRGSIFARMTAVGGIAELTTRRTGTEITLRWQR